MRYRKYGMMALVVLMAVLLSGCIHIRQEVTLKANDNWDAVMEIRFPASTVEQIGEEQMMMSQEDLEQGKAEAEAKGVKAEFDVRKEDNGDIVWRITYSGQGLELLNSTLFEEVSAFTAGENGRVKFSYDPGDITDMTSMGGSYTFVLNAGKVYSSNATETKGNTLTWKDPTESLQAEVGAGAAGGGLSVGVIILLVVLGLVIIIVLAVVLLYLRGKKMQQAPAAPAAPPTEPPAAPQA
jgi:uncharacterized iron-regulated membrane protein